MPRIASGLGDSVPRQALCHMVLGGIYPYRPPLRHLPASQLVTSPICPHSGWSTSTFRPGSSLSTSFCCICAKLGSGMGLPVAVLTLDSQCAMSLFPLIPQTPGLWWGSRAQGHLVSRVTGFPQAPHLPSLGNNFLV